MDNSTPEMNDVLIRYLDGELNGIEKEKLEQQLLSDQNIRRQYEQLVLARESVRQYGLRKKIAGIHHEMMEELKIPVGKISPVKRIIRYSMAAAAGVALLIAGIMLYNYTALTPEKVFSDNYQSYELSTTRGENAPEVSILEQDYREKKYAEVVTIVFDRPYSIRENFLKAMAWMELGSTARAIEQYKIVLKTADPQNMLKEEAEYYLALAYIRGKQYPLAIGQLESIQKKPGHLYHKKITPGLIDQVKSLNQR
jgi:tetratricopeptide (TPR) repeat protein